MSAMLKVDRGQFRASDFGAWVKALLLEILLNILKEAGLGITWALVLEALSITSVIHRLETHD